MRTIRKLRETADELPGHVDAATQAVEELAFAVLLLALVGGVGLVIWTIK